MTSTPPPDGIPAAIGARLAVDLDTVFADLADTLDQLRQQQTNALHAAVARALGVPSIDEDVAAHVARFDDRDAMRVHHLIAVHLANLGGLDVAGFVGQARRYGATWQEVGAVLGVARQTAHAQFRHVDPGARRLAEVPGGPDLDPLVPLDGGDDLTPLERGIGQRLGHRIGIDEVDPPADQG